MRSLPHEPDIVDQEQKEVYRNLQRVVGDACEEWLIKRGLATRGFRDTIAVEVAKSKKKEG